MRILLTNDDGIHAAGLRVLEEAIQPLSDDIGIAAPGNEQSGASHSVTLSAPLRVERLGPQRLAVHGRPADCVLVGVNILWDDGKWPDLILSGVNHGGNIGSDVPLSGTVGAAEQGAQMGIKSIAMSQDYPWDQKLDLSAAREAILPTVRALLARSWPEHGLFSVNFPSQLSKPAEIMITRSASTDPIHPADGITRSPFGREFAWLRPGTHTFAGPEKAAPNTIQPDDTQRSLPESLKAIPTDLDALSKGCIAATPLQIRRDHSEFLLNLDPNPIKI